MQRHYRKYVEAIQNTTSVEGWSRIQSGTVAPTDQSPKKRYSISEKSRGYLGLYPWVYGKDSGDPALRVCNMECFLGISADTSQNFVPKLTDHLLARILGQQYDPEPPQFTNSECDQVFIHGNRLQQRYTMTVYYTSYDLQRQADKINMRSRPYVMALSHGDPTHPYLYARVLGIYRIKVLHPNLTELTTMNVLWVRWLEVDQKYRAGWKAKRLHRVQFVPSHEEGAFGFLDPVDVIRGVHLIPAFKNAHIVNSHGASKWDYAPESNWKQYYVNQ